MKRSTNCLIPTVALSTTKSGLVSYHQRLATNPLRLRTERVFVFTKPSLLCLPSRNNYLSIFLLKGILSWKENWRKHIFTNFLPTLYLGKELQATHCKLCVESQPQQSYVLLDIASRHPSEDWAHAILLLYDCAHVPIASASPSKLLNKKRGTEKKVSYTSFILMLINSSDGYKSGRISAGSAWSPKRVRYTQLILLLSFFSTFDAQ